MFGAANRVRTGDVLLGKQVLYQLSYSRICVLYCQQYLLSTVLSKLFWSRCPELNQDLLFRREPFYPLNYSEHWRKTRESNSNRTSNQSVFETVTDPVCLIFHYRIKTQTVGLDCTVTYFSGPWQLSLQTGMFGEASLASVIRGCSYTINLAVSERFELSCRLRDHHLSKVRQ